MLKQYIFLAFALSLLCASDLSLVHARADKSPVLPFVNIDALPKEAHDTLRLIRQGKDFPYARDGAIFHNFEKRLPQQVRGYYREYTVKTPGARNRGARRIVCGTLAECYYSGDHYQTFQHIQK